MSMRVGRRFDIAKRFIEGIGARVSTPAATARDSKSNTHTEIHGTIHAQRMVRRAQKQGSSILRTGLLRVLQASQQPPEVLVKTPAANTDRKRRRTKNTHYGGEFVHVRVRIPALPGAKRQ